MITKIIKSLRYNDFHRDSTIYILASILGSSFSFILVAPLSHHLSQFDMGLVENFLSLTALFTGLATYGMDTIIIQNFTNKDKQLSLWSIYIFFLVNILIIGIAGSVLRGLFFNTLPINVFLISLLYSLANCFYTFYIKYLQLEKKALSYARITVTYGVINFAISLLLVVFLEWNYIGRLLGYFLPILFFIPTLVGFLRNKSTLPISSFSLGQIPLFYKLGAPLLLAQVFSWILERVDRLIISGIDSIDNAGVYGIGYQLGAIVLIISSAMTRAWLPNIITHLNTKNYKKIKKDLLTTISLLLLVAVGVSFFGILFLKYFIDIKFFAAANVIVIISFAYFMDGIWKLYGSFVIYHQKYSVYTATIVITGICNISLNFILIPKYSIEGAAFATLVSSFMGSIFTFLYCLKFKLIQ